MLARSRTRSNGVDPYLALREESRSTRRSAHSLSLSVAQHAGQLTLDLFLSHNMQISSLSISFCQQHAGQLPLYICIYILSHNTQVSSFSISSVTQYADQLTLYIFLSHNMRVSSLSISFCLSIRRSAHSLSLSVAQHAGQLTLYLFLSLITQVS